MSTQRHNAYFTEDGKLYYYLPDGTIRTIPSSAFDNIDDKIAVITADAAAMSAAYQRLFSAVSAISAISSVSAEYAAQDNKFIAAVYQTNGQLSAEYGGIEIATQTDIDNIFG